MHYAAIHDGRFLSRKSEDPNSEQESGGEKILQHDGHCACTMVSLPGEGVALPHDGHSSHEIHNPSPELGGHGQGNIRGAFVSRKVSIRLRTWRFEWESHNTEDMNHQMVLDDSCGNYKCMNGIFYSFDGIMCRFDLNKGLFETNGK
jgi:hypothetical protein